MGAQQLRLRARQGRKRAHGGEFTALPVEVVAGEEAPNRCVLRYSSIAGANSNKGPVTGAPESLVWFAVDERGLRQGLYDAAALGLAFIA